MWGQGSQNKPKPRGEELPGQTVQLMQVPRDVEKHVCISVCLDSGVRMSSRPGG